jgi:hypothetical protein
LDFGEDLMAGLDCFNLMDVRYSAQLPRIVVITAISIALYSQVTASDAATVTIDENLTIDASSSFPDPGLHSDGLLVQIVDGQSGPSVVSIVDGGLIGGSVNVRGASELYMSGGRIDAHTLIADSSTLTLAGGSISCRAAHCAADDVAYVVHVKDNGTLNFQGGAIGTDVRLDDSAVANVFGHSFVVEGDLPAATGSPTGVRVQGIYGNGTPFDITFIRDVGSAQVFLHAVPETASNVLVLFIAFLATPYRVDRSRSLLTIRGSLDMAQFC